MAVEGTNLRTGRERRKGGRMKSKYEEYHDQHVAYRREYREAHERVKNAKRETPEWREAMHDRRVAQDNANKALNRMSRCKRPDGFTGNPE